MSKKISLSFVMLAAVVLLSLSSIIGIFSLLINLFQHFTPLGFVSSIAHIINTLTPVALFSLLYLQQKRDTKKAATIILLIGGIATFFSVAISLLQFLKGGLSLYSVDSYINTAAKILMGIMYILASNAIRNGKTDKVITTISVIAVYVRILGLAASLIIVGSSAITAALAPIALLVGLSAFPKTILDYENCQFATKSVLTIIIVVVIVFVISMGIGLRIAYAPSGNTTDSGSANRCFNCGGSGWDSANNCSCVWCGGDGSSSWNP